MLLFGFLLFPVALSMARHVETQNYVLTIDNDTLKDIRIIGKLSDDLNLSSLGLKVIDKNAFVHLSNLKSLNLSNNSLKSLPEFALANLTNLENLDLANNNLDSGKFYVGLSNLKSLNISENPLGRYFTTSFDEGHFFGLTKSTDIYTQGIQFSTINSRMFENSSTIISRKPSPFEKILYWWWSAPMLEDNDPLQPLRINNNPSNRNSVVEVKVCIKNGHLKSVEAVINNEEMMQDCRKIPFDKNILRLNGLGIITFEKGWYRLQGQRVDEIWLYRNEITEITSELLNDLPAGIRAVNLALNKIEKLKRGVIKNENGIVLLDLGDNRISEIEDGALENLNVSDTLLLIGNRLRTTKFLDSLPSEIRSVPLVHNEISEISSGNFSKFVNFEHLDFRGNNITEIKSRRLQNFSSLKVLKLTRVNLKKIEPGAFQDLKNLEILDISENQISSLEKGTFDGLDSITHILLDRNKLKEIPNGVFNAMPNSLLVLVLSDNEIESLKTGTFVNAPTLFLDLSNNTISKIEKGAFNLPNLEGLHLGHNLLKDVHGDLFEGLDNLSALSLPLNNITTIKKGLVKKISKLYDLDLSHNPIKVLENGALFGLPKFGTEIHIYKVPVEIIQGGVFDDL